MGAFILFEKNKKSELDIKSVRSVFSNKGFSEPNVFSLGGSELWLYKKQLVEATNYYADGENSIYVIGTIVYKGLGYRKTIMQLLSDYIHDAVEYSRLIGSYCVIFYVSGKISILNDALNVCELFTDEKERFISSSFLAAVNSVGKLTIDRNASVEKLLTGYIVGENTLFNEVKRLIPSVYDGAWNLHKWDPLAVPEADTDRKKSIEDRTEAVKGYLKNIEKLAEEYKPELGLSGGYDSRLIFAAAQNTWPFKLDIHTHSTEGVNIHSVEKEIVKSIAKETGTKLNIVPTHNLDYYPGDEIESILKDGYYYFDGRCAYNMGAFSPTYTRKYKVDTVSDHGLTLNGLGGEVYRNYYMNIKPFVSTKQWMKAKVYPDGVDYVVDKAVFDAIHAYICRKMDKLLSFRWGKWISAFQIRRYYSEMRMPDCNGLNCNANNQVEFYLTPFIEKSTIENAYKARKYSKTGELQAEMITKLSPQIASFNSHYGFPFDQKEPVKYRIYSFIRGILPDSIWNFRINRVVQKGFSSNSNKKFFEKVMGKCSFLEEAAMYTEKLFPEINFDYLRTDYAMMPNSSYVSVVFYMLKDRIEG